MEGQRRKMNAGGSFHAFPAWRAYGTDRRVFSVPRHLHKKAIAAR
jgi:hypothetical protein